MDVGEFSDEDLDYRIKIDSLAELAEIEAGMVKKKLAKQGATKRKATTTASTTTTVVGSPKRKMSIDVVNDDDEGNTRPKRIIKTAEAAAAVPRKAQSVPLDDNGVPILPITSGMVTVHDLGQIITEKPGFHNKRYVWPIGFKSSRQYLSHVNPDTSVTYYSEVKDGGSAPLFEVWSEDSPDQKFQSATSTGVWSAVFKQANAIRGKDAANSASGPDFYGFSNNTIAMMIEMLPGIEGCLNYQRKNFEVTGKPPKAIGKHLDHNNSHPPSSSLDINPDYDINVQ